MVVKLRRVRYEASIAHKWDSMQTTSRRAKKSMFVITTLSRMDANQVRLPMLYYFWSAEQRIHFPWPCSCLSIWSRETSPMVPFYIGLIIFHAQAESGASSWTPRFSHSSATV